MRTLLSLLFALVVFPTASFASGGTKNAFTQCGIGAMIFQNIGWAAAISNIIWDLGTTASTSSSSTPSLCAGKGASVGKLIYENYASVEEETAIGQGKHLDAMLSILECDGSVHSAFISDVRADFMKSVSDEGYAQKSKLEKTEALFNNVMDKADNKFAAHCSAG